MSKPKISCTKQISNVISYTIVVLHYYMNKVITIIPVVDCIIVINVCHPVLLHAMNTENYIQNRITILRVLSLYILNAKNLE